MPTQSDFKVYHEDELGEGIYWKYRGYTHEAAAEAYGIRYDERGDHALTDGSNIKIQVKSQDGVLKEFIVRAEKDVNYIADEVNIFGDI